MNDIVSEKQDLPAPYDQDLSKVLRNLDRATEQGHIETANSRVTASFLRAGMTLIGNELGPGARRRQWVPGAHYSVQRRLLDFLSQRQVVRQASRNDAPFDRIGSMGAFRDRWKSNSLYIADLLRFGLAIATAEGDDVIRRAISENYRSVIADWQGTYQRAFTARGLRPRAGASFTQLAHVLAAMAEGMAMREFGDADSPIRVDTDWTLLGEGALWLLVGCLQADDDDDPRTAEERMRAMTGPA